MDKETKQMFELVLNKLEKLEEKFEKKFDIFGEKLEEVYDRQDDIYRVLRGIEHSNEVNGAEIEHLKIRNAKIEGTLRKASEVITENVG